MGRPRLLNMLAPGPDEVLYTKAPSLVTTIVDDDELVVQETIEEVQNGAMIIFTAPCDCENVTVIRINGIIYELLNAVGEIPTEAFEANSLVSVVLDANTTSAYIQNAASATPTDLGAANIFATATVDME